jgi:hypothetical protein
VLFWAYQKALVLCIQNPSVKFLQGLARPVHTALLLLALGIAPGLQAQPLAQFYSATNSLGRITNGATVFHLSFYAKTNLMPSPWASSPVPPSTLAPDIRERLMARRTQAVAQVYFFTNRDFISFRPESLVNLAWTNLITHTNGRSPLIWSERKHPLGWPARSPIVKWNTDCLIWGMKGLTALSPCWEGESGPGQIAITALTRRHGYARGHGMGAAGFRQLFAGKRVWFLSTHNEIVQVKATRELVRTLEVDGRDYTLVLFDKDLPQSIEPIRVCLLQDMMSRFAFADKIPCPLLMTEQTGNVSAGIPGFSFDVFKGGDSGSPNLLPLPGELVFYNGRTTSPPSPELQADMDELCRREGLNPANYRMQWVDLTSFPKY